MASNAVDRNLALQLLQKAIAEHPKGKAGVAARLGCSRALLARVLSPNDEAGMSDKLARRVLDTYHVIRACPATGGEMPIHECRRIALGPAPTHNPQAMRIWKTCHACPHKPEPNPKGDPK